MHPADLVILTVLALSLIFGFMRGFVREALSLAGWVLAIIVARWFNEPMSAWLAQWVSTPSVRLV
ncbi:CvpA family protein, partial [Acinetobacter baumannii]